jgi:hypothetical protein
MFGDCRAFRRPSRSRAVVGCARVARLVNGPDVASWQRWARLCVLISSGKLQSSLYSSKHLVPSKLGQSTNIALRLLPIVFSVDPIRGLVLSPV